MALYLRGGVYHYDFAVNGKRYRGTTKQKVLSRARQIESTLMHHAQTNDLPIVRRKIPTLFENSERFLEWVKSSPLEPNTKMYYQHGWRVLQKTPLLTTRLDRITRDDIECLELPGSAANANCALRTLRRMFGKAEEWGLITRVPKFRLRKEYSRAKVIDAEAEAKLFAVAKQPLRDVLILMLDTGMRPSEVFATRWEDVLWDRDTIFVPKGKTKGARRHVPMSDRVRDALHARVSDCREGWVFPSDSKTGHLESVASAFRTARKDAGLASDIVLYCARHRFATDTLNATGNLAVLMQAMGHSDTKTAMVYQHPHLEQVRQAINARNTSERHNHVTAQ